MEQRVSVLCASLSSAAPTPAAPGAQAWTQEVIIGPEPGNRPLPSGGPAVHLPYLVAAVLFFIIVLGSFFAAVGAEPPGPPPSCTDEWRGRRPDPVAVRRGELKMLCFADLTGSNLTRAALARVNLTDATLTGADLTEATLAGSILLRTKLSGATLTRANLTHANFTNADLTGTYLEAAEAPYASFVDANLTNAMLFGIDLSHTVWLTADLCRAYFEPGKLPLPQDINRVKNLWSLRFINWSGALTILREDFKRVGLRDQERELTFALQQTRTLRAWYRWPGRPSDASIRYAPCASKSDAFTKRLALYFDRAPDVFNPSASTIGEKGESIFRFVMFDLTSAYGMYPGRPLCILAGLFLISTVLYACVLRLSRAVRIREFPYDVIAPLSDDGPRPLLRVIRIASQFSLLSTFAFSWRELAVGNWITRLQSREYTLRATGWVRAVSGWQALISVYLVALWVLTYFGRPFE